jgi:hypothetical protein
MTLRPLIVVPLPFTTMPPELPQPVPPFPEGSVPILLPWMSMPTLAWTPTWLPAMTLLYTSTSALAYTP